MIIMRPPILRVFHLGKRINIQELNAKYLEVNKEIRKLNTYKNYLEDRIKYIKSSGSVPVAEANAP